MAKTDVSGAAAANMFSYTEHSITLVKAYLKKQGFQIRHDSEATYLSTRFDPLGRLIKKSEQELEKLLFRKITDEII
jgi:hypothetical protein